MGTANSTLADPGATPVTDAIGGTIVTLVGISGTYYLVRKAHMWAQDQTAQDQAGQDQAAQGREPKDQEPESPPSPGKKRKVTIGETTIIPDKVITPLKTKTPVTRAPRTPPQAPTLAPLRAYTSIDGSMPSMDEIEPGLFIGNMASVESERYLKDHNITAVVSLVNPLRLPFHDQANPAHYHPLENFDLKNRLVIGAEDREWEDLLKHMAGACKFIDAHLNPPTEPASETDDQVTPQEKPVLPGTTNKEPQKHNVLVHCTAGVSRSATIVVAYLMWKQGKAATEVLAKVVKKRLIVRPNNGFLDQLCVWQDVGYDVWMNEQFLVPKPEYEKLKERMEAGKRVKELERLMRLSSGRVKHPHH